MSTQKVTPIILSGGSGTRLWPLSRADMPKQFIPLNADHSLFEDTLARCAPTPTKTASTNTQSFNAPKIICAQQHRFLIHDLLKNKDTTPYQIVMEPCPRNTAAACITAALAADTPDDIILIMPSDHHIPDHDAFCDTITAALPLATQGKIITFGIVPTSAHTGYGYIQRGDQIDAGYTVTAFHEKPDTATAKSYLASQDHLWNSGIFMGRAATFIEEFKAHAPDILDHVQNAWDQHSIDLGDILLNPDAFKQTRSQSIDYAVLEKTTKAVVIPVNYSWSDLGEWDALWDISNKDTDNNVKHGHTYTHNVNNAFLQAQDGITLAVSNLTDITIIAMKDAVFVGPKNGSNDIKSLITQMQAANDSRVIENPFTMRPWGSYEIMEERPGYKVKKLTINSGSKLSLQKHKHRSEHWVVVKGIATVTRDTDVFDVKTNESIYIPCGAVHRLENKQIEALEIIEVQTGDYLGEDDIIRIEDDYNRLPNDQK